MSSNANNTTPDPFETAINELDEHDINQAKQTKNLHKSLNNTLHHSIFKPLSLSDCQPITSSFSAEDQLWYTASPLAKNQINRLKKGPERRKTIDLHALTQHEAIDLLNNLLQKAEKEQQNEWIIIHGKGHQSTHQGHPILKNLLATYLKKQPLILAYASAQPKDGGRGAVYVLLKKNKDA
jgi:DNA-nicking Smr family endonuclease